MARKPRVFIEGGVYHVYNRVASGEEIFADPEETRGLLDLIRLVKQRDGWTVFAWCVMSNHYHLALRTSAVPLSRGMHHIQCSFSRGFNRRRGRTGGVWQSRYQAKLVDEQGYLSRVILYIHLNPIRAGIVRGALDHVFSGHRELMKSPAKALIDVDDALLCFGDIRKSARWAYRSAIRAGTEGDSTEADEEKGILHLSWFDPQLEPAPGRQHVDVMGRSTGLECADLTASQFTEAMCGLLNEDLRVLASRTKVRSTVEARRIIATLGVERWGQKGKDLAGVLHKNPDVVSQWVGQGVRRRLEDPEFSRRLDQLDQQLDKHIRARQLSEGMEHNDCKS